MLVSRRNRGGPAVTACVARQSPAAKAVRWALAAAIAAVMGWLATPASALTFNVTATPNMDSTAIAAFQTAADAWSKLVVTPITVNIAIDYVPLTGKFLGLTSMEQEVTDYDSFRSALETVATSADDAQAVASLPTTSWFPMLINRTANNPNGSGSAEPYLGISNNAELQLSRASAKAIGVLGATAALDGSIRFNSNFKWSFSQSGGIASDSYDFVGAAMHEIGHVLGFLSRTETLDGKYDDWRYIFTPLDLFRYSADSAHLGVIDWTNDARLKYFSLDKGVTSLGGFATGITYGDGYNAGHWRMQDPAIGIMDPTLAMGERADISMLDLRAMDVIGYQVVPEPGTLAVLLAGAWLLRRRGQRRQYGQFVGLQHHQG